jgi:hypothetical protein
MLIARVPKWNGCDFSAGARPAAVRLRQAY